MLENRVKAAIATACVALCSWMPSANAQPFPNKPIRLIIPFSAGGSNDVVGRIVAQELEKILGQTVVVENKTGASGLIGSMEVARARADGYTLLYNASNQVYLPLASTKKTYDAVKDFTPIAQVGYVPLAVVVRPSSPVKSLVDFAALGRAQGKPLTWAAPGIASIGHLTSEMISRDLKLESQVVVYRGGVQALTDVMGGHITAYAAPMTTVGQLIKGGQVKAVAVTSSKRLAGFPDVPTVAESGVPGFEISSWYGLWGPAGMPKDVAETLNAAVNKAIQAPAAKARFAELSFETAENTQAQFASMIDGEIRRFAHIISTVKISVDP